VGGGPITNYFIYLANGHKLGPEKLFKYSEKEREKKNSL
jgi:hypothetical protein